MSKMFAVLTAGLVALAATAIAPEPASAQVRTPRGCHWAPRSDGMLELWCKNDIGDSYPTGRVMEPSYRGSADSDCPGGGYYNGVRCVGGKRAAPRHKPRTAVAAPAPSPAAEEEALPASAAPAESSAPPESSAPAPTGFGEATPVQHKGGGVFGWLASLWAAIIGFFAHLFGH